MPQILLQRGRLLEGEGGAFSVGFCLVLAVVREEKHRHVGLTLFDPPCKQQSRLAVQLAPSWKFDVGYDAEHEIPVLLVRGPSFFEVRTEEDLGTRPHPEQLVRQVDPLGDQAARLLQHLGVDDRQQRRVGLDVVLDDDDGLHTDHARVVRHIHAVFEVLNDGDDDAKVPLPDENLVKDVGRGRYQELLQLPVVVCEEDNGNTQTFFLHHPCEMRSVHVVDMQRRDDQIETSLLLGEFDGFTTA